MTRRTATSFRLLALVGLLITAVLCAASAVFASDPPASRRAEYNFNSDWKHFVGDPAGAEAPGFDDSLWKEVTLPRAWNEDDANVHTREFNRLYPLEAEYPWASPEQVAEMKRQLGYDW